MVLIHRQTKPAAKTVVAKAASGKPARRLGDASAAAETHEAGTVVVTRTFKDGTVVKADDTKTETLMVRKFLGPVAHVSVNAGATRGTGVEYESARVGVMVTLPCYVEELDDAYQTAAAKAAEYLAAELESLPEAEAPAADPEVAEEGVEEGTEEAPDEGTDEIDEDYIKTLTRDQLVAFVKENDLNVNAKKFASDKAGTKKLAAAVWEAVEATQATEETGDEADADEEATEETGDEAADEEATSDEPYTREEFEKATIKELKGLWADWDMGDLPKTKTESAQKVLMIKKLLAHQDEQAE